MKNNAGANLAEKIAKMIETESQGSDLASMFASIDKLNHRIEKLEAASADPHSSLRPPHSNHPSLDRFAIAEAIVDDLFAREGKEKACTFEPSGKPCDHCSMCNSRGF